MFSLSNLYQQQKSKMSKVNLILQERNIRQILEVDSKMSLYLYLWILTEN